MKDGTASLVAFLVAPVVPAIAFALSSPGLGGGLEVSFRSLIGLLAIGYMYSLWFAGLLALPLFLVLHRLGILGITSSILGGTFVGALVPLVIRLPATSPFTEWLYLVSGAFPFSCTAGAIAGLVFWIVRKVCTGMRRKEVRI